MFFAVVLVEVCPDANLVNNHVDILRQKSRIITELIFDEGNEAFASGGESSLQNCQLILRLCIGSCQLHSANYTKPILRKPMLLTIDTYTGNREKWASDLHFAK